MLGGISGHAGLFSNSYEVAVVLQAMIQKGKYDNLKLFSQDSFDKFNFCYFCDKDNRSGVGFDKPQIEGKHGSTFGGVSSQSFGHYGYTGSMAWADPDKNIFLFSFQIELIQLEKILYYKQVIQELDLKKLFINP